MQSPPLPASGLKCSLASMCPRSRKLPSHSGVPENAGQECFLRALRQRRHPLLHCPVPTPGKGKVNMARLPALWPTKAVYRLLPSDWETRSLPSGELARVCRQALPGSLHLQETGCEAGLWRGRQKMQSLGTSVPVPFHLCQLIQ